MKFSESDNMYARGIFTDIYSLSKKYYDSDCPIAKVSLSKNFSIESIMNFLLILILY